MPKFIRGPRGGLYYWHKTGRPGRVKVYKSTINARKRRKK